MATVRLTWQDWRRVIATLRAKRLPYMLDHAYRLEERLELHPRGEPVVALDLNDDVYLRSFNWARLQLGLPLPPTEESEVGADPYRRRQE